MFSEPLLQHRDGFKLGSCRARLVEQCDGIPAVLAGRRVAVKSPVVRRLGCKSRIQILVGKFLTEKSSQNAI